MNDETTRDICDPNRWGLPAEAIADLGNRLQNFWERFRGNFKTRTHNVAGHAWTYLRGLLLMKTKRNFANIDRRVIDPEGDGQNLQQFMSDSPWAAQPPIQQVQQEIASTPGLAQGGVLLLDESPDEKAGWDEFQAQKYRAWEHHLALTILATWFIAQTKYDWARTHARDPQLAQQMELDVLPALSVANVRELLQAVMPLPQFSQDQATRLVVKHLVKRSRSTRSCLSAQRSQRGQI